MRAKPRQPGGAPIASVETKDGRSPTYAVVWREADGPLHAGRLEPGAAGLRLTGSNGRAREESHKVAYAEISEARVGRTGLERLNGRPALVLERYTEPPLRIGTLEGPGALTELVELVAGLLAAARARATSFAVVAPLKKNARERARTLVEAGPPFDLGGSSLTRHEVFLAEREVVFVFEGADAHATVAELLSERGLWKAAASWRACLAGPPHLAGEIFTWRRDP